MRTPQTDYIREWRKKNSDKVKRYNKQYLENLKQKAVDEALKERDGQMSGHLSDKCPPNSKKELEQ